MSARFRCCETREGMMASFTLTFTVLLCLRPGSALWRYYCRKEDGVYFSTRTSITLEYEGSSFLEWNYPETCTVQNKRSPITVLKCTSPGVFTINPLLSEMAEDDIRTFQVASDAYCYLWYVTTVPKSRLNATLQSNEQVLRIWVIDPENADTEEFNNTALEPSLLSTTITRQFWSGGQNPKIETRLTKKAFSNKYDAEKGYWQSIVEVLPGDTTVKITSTKVTFQDCFIFDSFYTLSMPFQSTSKIADSLSISLQSGKRSMLVWQACSPANAAWLTSSGIFISFNSFKTSEKVKVPENMLNPLLQNNVTSASIVNEGILFLINGTIYKWEFSGSLSKLGLQHNLIEYGIVGMQSTKWCPEHLYPIRKGSKKFTVIAVWTTHELYLGNASGTSFSKIANSTKFLNILKLPIQSTVNILTVSSGSRPPEIGVLLKVCNTCDFTDKRLWLLIFDEETDKWSVNSLFARTHSNLLPKGPFTMEFFQSALPSLLLGNNETIFYSLGNNTQRGKLLLPGTNNFVNASGGSIIHQITTDISGNVLIKMANNKLFFSKIGTEDTIILPDWENADTDMIFYSVPTGNTYVLKLKGTWVQRQVYPLEMEIFSATANLTNGCLYTKFYHNMSVPVYYLDMGEQLFAWAQIIYKEDFGISMRLAKNRDLLHVDQNMELEITNGMCIRNLTIKVHHEKDYSGIENYASELQAASGVTTLEVEPSFSGLTCPVPLDKISHISKGCPPMRNIRFERPPELRCRIRNIISYVIPRLSLRYPSKTSLEVKYDWEKYGCLLEVERSERFKPRLALYDGDIFIKNVDANFIIWEIHGRKDYYFNTTMEKAGCLREAQSWKSMIAMQEDATNLSLGDIWGPQNYRSCFEVTLGVLGDLSQPYEILNSTSRNFLTWPDDYNGIYIFKAKILDPNFSFCDLRVTFPIKTVGKTESPGSKKRPLLLSISLIVILSVGGFSYYKSIKVFQDMQFKDPWKKTTTKDEDGKSK